MRKFVRPSPVEPSKEDGLPDLSAAERTTGRLHCTNASSYFACLVGKRDTLTLTLTLRRSSGVPRQPTRQGLGHQSLL